MVKKVLIAGGIALCIFWSGQASARPEVALRIQSMGQLYKGVGGDTLFPLSNYGHLYVYEPKRTSNLTFDFRYALDPSGDDHRFDLYRGVAEITTGKNTPVIDVGRMQLVEGIDYLLLDGVKLNGYAGENLNWSLFGGWTRDTEIGVNRDAGLLGGVRLSHLGLWKIRNRFSFLYEDYENGAKGNRLSFSLGRDFRLPTNIGVDAGMEFSLVKNDFSRLFFTNDVELIKSVSAHMSYYYRNPLQDEAVERDSIYRVFAASGTHYLRPGLSFFLGDLFVFEPSYELSRYRALNGVKRNSHRTEAALRLLPNKYKVHGLVTTSYWKTYQGRNWMSTFSAGHWVTPIVDVSVGGEVAYYEKYTNENATASRGFLEIGIMTRSQLKFSGTLETISNEDKKIDLRFMFFLQAMLGSES